MTDVVIAGIGMMTSVGLTAGETAASVRSAAMRLSLTNIRDRMLEPFTLAEVPEDGLPALADALERHAAITARERRMLRLATMPLRECLAAVTIHAPTLGLCLSLPENGTKKALDGAAFLARLALQTNGAFDPTRSDASHVGRAGGILAIGQAVATIRQGRAEFMIAGGLDTYRDLYVLGTLDQERRVKSPSNLDGFVPGEGAAFLLLASREAAAARGLTPMARVSPVAVGFEPGHLYSEDPYRGDGLATTLAQLVAAGAVESPLAEVYSPMNGENHWAKEWGVSHIRNRAAFHPSHGMHHPADCYGETGAACGPLMAGLAAVGIKASYRRSPALVYGSSDRGSRAALVVSAAQH